MQLERYRGDTLPIMCTVSTVATQTATNITGCSFLFTVNSLCNPPDNTTQVMQVVGDVADAVNGVVQFAPTVDQVNLVGFYYFDIQMTDTYGNTCTLVKGSIVFRQDITK